MILYPGSSQQLSGAFRSSRDFSKAFGNFPQELPGALESSQELSREPSGALRSLWACQPEVLQPALGLGGKREAFTIATLSCIADEARSRPRSLFNLRIDTFNGSQ